MNLEKYERATNNYIMKTHQEGVINDIRSKWQMSPDQGKTWFSVLIVIKKLKGRKQ